MARLIQDKLKVALADELLFGRLENGGIAVVDAVAGEIVITIPEPAAPASSGGGELVLN
jgi:ATP-dependent Clp protease ATP-binding subunit ClpA